MNSSYTELFQKPIDGICRSIDSCMFSIQPKTEDKSEAVVVRTFELNFLYVNSVLINIYFTAIKFLYKIVLSRFERCRSSWIYSFTFSLLQNCRVHNSFNFWYSRFTRVDESSENKTFMSFFNGIYFRVFWRECQLGKYIILDNNY